MSRTKATAKSLIPGFLFLGFITLLLGVTGGPQALAGQRGDQGSVFPDSTRIKRCTSVTQLTSALQTARPGSVLILADGNYNLPGLITIGVRGQKNKPVLLRAEHTGKVILTGQGGFSIIGPAAYIVIQGFVFRHSSSKAKSGPGTSHCRWTQNVFETTGKGEDLTIAGSDQEIDHNTFQHKNAMGRFLAIRGSGAQIATDLWIHHNYFADYKDQGGLNGAEAFQFGLSGYSMSASHSLVEYNLFERCDGEAELISVKASDVTLRYNTFRDSKAQFTLRHGNHSAVYGNYFFRTPGIRFFGDDHEIYSNYFENCPIAIQIGNGDGEVKDGAKLTCHDRPDRDFVGFNTLVDNKKNIVFNARKEGLGATKIQISANLIEGGGPAAQIETGGGALMNTTWSDNIIHTQAGGGDMPMAQPSGNKVMDAAMLRLQPRLTRPASRVANTSTTPVLHLSADSPLMHPTQNKNTFAFVRSDIDGQPRKGALDIGADQRAEAPVINIPLAPSDVGAGNSSPE